MNTDYNNGSGQLLGGAAASKEGGGSSSHAFPAQGGVISISFALDVLQQLAVFFRVAQGQRNGPKTRALPLFSRDSALHCIRRDRPVPFNEPF